MTAHADDDAGLSGAPRKKFSGKKLVLFVLLPLILLLGAGAGVYVSGVLDMLLGKKEEAVVETPKPDEAEALPAFYDLPDMLVNLNSTGKRPAFLKIKISIQMTKKADEPALVAVLPRIVDNFQVYLRELRLEDLKGSAGMYRLRQELLLRVSAAAFPVKIKDVLFREMLVQ